MQTVNNKTELTKGDKVTVQNNSIAQMMGYETLTGTVFLVNPNAHVNTVTIKCDQTGCLELVEIGDGEIWK